MGSVTGAGSEFRLLDHGSSVSTPLAPVRESYMNGPCSVSLHILNLGLKKKGRREMADLLTWIKTREGGGTAQLKMRTTPRLSRCITVWTVMVIVFCLSVDAKRKQPPPAFTSPEARKVVPASEGVHQVDPTELPPQMLGAAR